MTDWHAAPGDSPHTLQYRGCGKEGKYIHFTPDFLLNDALTAGYGSRGKRDASLLFRLHSQHVDVPQAGDPTRPTAVARASAETVPGPYPTGPPGNGAQG